MSIDPLAAGGADLAALLDAEIASLAADAQALGALLVEGAVVSARVLPSNGLTDLIDIAGRRVAASLPPTVRPGDVIAVQVTGFDGGRILLQIVDSGSSATSAPAQPSTGFAPPAGAFVAASIRPATPPPASAQPAAANAQQPPASAQQTPASAQQTPASAQPPPQSTPAGQTPPTAAALGIVLRHGTLGAYAPARPAAPIPGQAGASLAVSLAADADGPTSIEARLATASAALAPRGSNTLPAAAPAGAGPVGAGRVVQPGIARFVAAPPLAPSPPLAASPLSSPSLGAPQLAPKTGLSAYAEPAALLRGLRLPVTPATIAAATLALDRPDRLPAALAALERALPNAGADPHVATLRALLPFVGRIEPDSPVLATQIAAFVDHVVDGAEPKLATLLAANAAADALPSGANAALAAERAAALGANLKQTVLALAADAPAPEPLGPALAGALTALTSVQAQAAQLLAARPDGLAFTVPLTTPFGQQNAHVAVQREAPQGRGVPLDGANFRIAFVLDTAHYGTIALDLVTVGRDVTVDLRAETAPAMRAFRDALSSLTARLESLRYRVASADAVVGAIAPVSTPTASPTPAELAPRAASGLAARPARGAVDRSA